ncbi:MAG: type II toxin-antitoxin system HicB family antitoxin [Verrucomicrobia bacterium]|nr:type II toxin-antitoxin system HicB family antitoxin [Verrucomicrobiota bacterium]
MLTAYIAKAVEKARYEPMENGRFFATIPGFKGLWAEGKTVEAARRELIETLEDWLLLAFRFGDDVPVVGGIDLNKVGRHAKTRQPA